MVYLPLGVGEVQAVLKISNFKVWCLAHCAWGLIHGAH